MSSILAAKKLKEVVSGNSLSEQEDVQATALLLSALDADNQLIVIDCQSARDIWNRLESRYENKTYESEDLYARLLSYKINNLGDIGKAVGEAQLFVSKLKSLGETLTEKLVMGIIIKALPDSFQDRFINSWSSTSTADRTLNNLITRISSRAEMVSRK
ncbi:hypothetical protein GZH46_00539, partial [Fragariocoptes setiger]